MTKSELLKVAKPILFNTEMVRAILEGRKTVTRKIVKPMLRDDEYGFCVWYNKITENHVVEKYDEDGGSFSPTRYVNSQYHKGDILYVRETAKTQSMKRFKKSVKLLFKADDKLQEFKVSDEFYKKLSGYSQGKWLSPYYLTKEVARIFLKVTDVRVERLKDITEAEAKAEGIRSYFLHKEHGGEWREFKYFFMGADWSAHQTRKKAFANLWNSTIKKQDLDKYSWEANPWVWVYEFERIEI